MSAKHATAAESAWLDEIAGMGCILTWHIYGEFAPGEIHHLFDPSQRSHFLVVCLTPEFHRGPNGFHGLGGEPGFRRRYKLGEVEMLAMTLERRAKQLRRAA
jgi:hypothetical protein